jgi:hypothetical protein
VAAGDRSNDREYDEGRVAFLETALAERDARRAEMTSQFAKLTDVVGETRGTRICRRRADRR